MQVVPSPSSTTANAAPNVLNSQSDADVTRFTMLGSPKRQEYPHIPSKSSAASRGSSTLQATLARYHRQRGQSRTAAAFTSSHGVLAATQTASVTASAGSSQARCSQGNLTADHVQVATDFNSVSPSGECSSGECSCGKCSSGEGSSGECSTAAVVEIVAHESDNGSEPVTEAVLRDRTRTASPSSFASPNSKLSKQNISSDRHLLWSLAL